MIKRWYTLRIKDIIDKDNFNITKKYKKYFSLIFEKIETLNITEDRFPAFDPLLHKLRENDVDRINDYFKKTLSLNYCNKCLKIYSEVTSSKKCEISDCEGGIVSFYELLDDPIEIFNLFYNFHKYPSRILKEYSSKLILVNKNLNDLQNQIEMISKGNNFEDNFFNKGNDNFSEEDKEKLEELNMKKEGLYSQLLTLAKLKENLEKTEFEKILKRSEFANLMFNIRNINDQIEIREAFLEKTSDDRTGYVLSYRNGPTQEISNVLSRYHPYAIVQYGFKKNIVLQIEKDSFRTDKISENYQFTEIPKRQYCISCNIFLEDISHLCFQCGNNLTEFVIMYPSRVYIHSEDLMINQSREDITKYVNPGSLYPLSNKRRKPKKTYCEVHHYLDERDFKPLFKLTIPFKNKDDEFIELLYGNMKVYSFSDSFSTLFEDNLYDKVERPFKVCSECLTIWDQGKDENGDTKNTCPKNPEEHRDPIFIRLINILETEGIKVNFNSSEITNNSNLSHTLIHGLRVSLQKISGVDIREIAEVYDKKKKFYIYDTVPGGNAICESIFKKINDEFLSLMEAVEIISTLLSDKCKNGCPLCLYQFNCIERNNPKSFSKNLLKDYLDLLDLSNLSLTSM